MLKNKKIFWWCTVVLVAVVLFGALALSYFVFRVPLFDASGWHTTDAGVKQYLDYFGKPSVGWLTVDNRQYYFDGQGAMCTGWLQLDNGRYYLGQDGVMQTGWLETDDGTYYLQDDGVACTGWLETDEGRFYFDESYRMHTGWLETDDGTYYLQENGKAYSGWMTTPQARYYMFHDGAVATGFVTVDGAERYFLENGEYVPLVNPDNPLPEHFEPQLVQVGEYQVDATCVQALQEMMDACKEAGNKVKINSAYRDLKQQQAMWDKYRKNYISQGYSYAQAEKMTAGYVAVPGTSEHHLGLGIDIGTGSKTYAWLAEHCWEYGFILRYPEGKKSVTGFNYEPWHFRYLGKPMAKAVHESGLTLEEYLESIK